MGASHAQEQKIWRRPTKKILFVIIAVMALSVGLAVFAITNSNAEGQTDLSLQQALDLALANNSQIYLAGVDVNAAQLSYNQAKESADSLQQQINETEAKGVPVVVTQEMAMVMDIAPSQSKLAWELSDLTFDYTINSVRYGVVASYYGLVQAKEALELAKSTLATAEKQYDDMQAKYTNGTISKLELLNARTAVSTAECDVLESQNTVDSVMMSLNQLLGMDIYTQINPTSKLSYDDAGVDYQAAYQAALTTDATVGAMRMSWESAQALETFYQQYRGDNDYQYDTAKMDTRKAETSYNQAKISLEISVRKAYNELEKARQSYLSLNESLDVAKEAARLTQVRYDNGLGTIDEVNSANNSYLQVQLANLNALSTYQLAKARFDYGIFDVATVGGMGTSYSSSSGYSSLSSGSSLTLLMGIIQGLIEQWGLDQIDMESLLNPDETVLPNTYTSPGNNTGSTYSGNTYTNPAPNNSSSSNSSSSKSNKPSSSGKNSTSTNSAAGRDTSSPSNSASSTPIELQGGVDNANSGQTPADLNPSSSYGTYLPDGNFVPVE